MHRSTLIKALWGIHLTGPGLGFRCCRVHAPTPQWFRPIMLKREFQMARWPCADCSARHCLGSGRGTSAHAPHRSNAGWTDARPIRMERCSDAGERAPIQTCLRCRTVMLRAPGSGTRLARAADVAVKYSRRVSGSLAVRLPGEAAPGVEIRTRSRHRRVLPSAARAAPSRMLEPRARVITLTAGRGLISGAQRATRTFSKQGDRRISAGRADGQTAGCWAGVA